MHRLPSRIVAVVIGTVLVFVLTVTGSVLWLSRALDDQARRNALAQVRVARDGILAQVEGISLDYSKWDEAALRVAAQDRRWLFDNIGSAASLGVTLQALAIWGGPFAEDLGWIDDGAEEGRPGILEPDTLDLIESRLAEVPIGAMRGTGAFFAWSHGSLYAVAAARIEMVLDQSGPAVRDADLARIAVGQRIGTEPIAAIAESTLLSGFEVAVEPPSGHDSLPLLGGDGQPVAYLAWDVPRPGTTMLWRMLPPLAGVLALTTGLAALGMSLVRRSAQHLVTAKQEATTAARTDALTGLPNRAAFNEALSAPARAGERAILFLDVNGFKGINDSIGHAAGDEVIAELARRLARLGAEGRMLARIGGTSSSSCSPARMPAPGSNGWPGRSSWPWSRPSR